MLTLTAVAIIVNVLTYTATGYLTYRTYAHFTERDGLIPAKPAFVRFTPFTNACVDIANQVSTSSDHVECDNVQPVISERGFGWVAPIQPAGMLQVFLKNNPGFFYLDDSFEASQRGGTGHITRIDDVQQYGVGMEWFDNLDRLLALTDFFANYDTPHYLALDPTQPTKLTTVVAKIKYGMLWRLPYWGGVVLVHSDGKVEDLSVEEAKADPRLKNQWIFPLSLAGDYVDLQNYGVGWGILSPFVTVPGKLEIEDLPDENKFPFLTYGSDGVPYLVTATKGAGSARGLFRMYFVNATNGIGTYHEFDSHGVVYGPAAALERMTNIPGYQWARQGGESAAGTIVATEPVYLVRPNDPALYWKFTITNIKSAGISATAVAHGSRPDDIKVFQQRADFEAWLLGEDPETIVMGEGLGTKAELQQILEQIKGLVGEFEAKVQTLPDD